MPEITYAWAPITKAEPQPDGSVIVTGVLTDAGKDRDGQGMNQAWLDQAVPKWFDESGNIREQHDPKRAAGVGIGLHRREDGAFILQSRITDPVAVKKCVPAAEGERAVYQGYSIGVRQPHISFANAEFPAGEVVGGYICESSLADRPSNPRSMFLMAKSDGPEEKPYLIGKAQWADGDDHEPDADADDVPDTISYDGPDQVASAANLQDNPTVTGARPLTPNPTNPGGPKPKKKAKKKAEEPDLTKDWAEFDAERGLHPRVPDADNDAGGGGGAVTAAAAHAANWAKRDVSQGYGGDPRIKAGDFAPSIRIGDKVNFAHPEGGRVEGHVLGIEGNHIQVAHAGQVTRVAREDVAHGPSTSFLSPAKAKGGGGGEGKHGGTYSEDQKYNRSGGAAAALDPQTRDAAKRQEEYDYQQKLAQQAMHEGMFEAAVRQATEANARRGGRTMAKAEEPDLLKFVSRKQRKKYAKQGIAMPNGDFPIPDMGHLQSAIGHLGGYNGDRDAAKAHIKKRAREMGVDVNLDGDGATEKIESMGLLLKAAGWLYTELVDLGTLEKAHGSEEIEDMDKKEVAAMITAAVTDATKGIEQRLGDRLDKAEAALASRLEKVEASPIPGGPQVRRIPGQSQLAKIAEVKQVQDEIAYLDQLAQTTKAEDPNLSRGYSDQADELRERLLH